MKTFAQWVIALTRGYIKATGKKPDKLAKLKINMEAGQKVRDQEKILTPDFGKNKPWYKVEGELTHNDKIDWLVKNVDPNAAQTIPPKPALEAMLRDGREDLIDHFFEMHTKKIGSKPQINIDTSDLKHPELVKKMMMDEKLKPTLVKTEAQIKKEIEKQNKESIKRLKDKMKDKDPEKKAYGGLAGMLGERTGYKDAKKVKGRDEEIFYPPYETNDPEEAAKEIIQRLINVDPAKIPLTDKIELMFDLNRIKAGGSTDLLGGELNFGYNKNFGRDDAGYGFEWKRKFAGGGLAPMLGEPTYTDENHRVPFSVGGFNAARRAFLQWLGAGAATAGAAKTGLFGLLKGGGKKPDFTVKLRTQFLNSDVDYGTSGLAHFDISAATPKVKKVLYGLMKNREAVKPGLKGKDYSRIEPEDAKQVIKKLQDQGFKGKITGIIDDHTGDGGIDVLKQAEKAGHKNFVDDFKKSSMRKNIAEHKRYQDFVVYENDPGFKNWSKATKGKLDKPYVSTIDEVVDLLEPVVKKAEGGRVSLSNGGVAGMLGE